MLVIRNVATKTIRSLKRVFGHETAVALLVIVLGWGAFSLWQTMAAPGKIDPALSEIMKEAKYTPRIELDLGFTPEDFHITYVQRFGPMAGVSGQKIFMIQVPAEDFWQMAKLYWVREIRLAQ